MIVTKSAWLGRLAGMDEYWQPRVPHSMNHSPATCKLRFMMNVRRLRTLHAVARFGSVTAAARALNFTAPAVSQQLAALEREIGMPVMERSGRGIRLTRAAEILVGHTDQVLAQLERAEAELDTIRATVSGRVRVASFSSAAHALIPRAWARMRRGAPKVSLDLIESEPGESLPSLLRGELDVAVVHHYDTVPQVLDPALERHLLMNDPMLAAFPSGLGPGRTDPMALAELRACDFIIPHPSSACAQATLRACGEAGFAPHSVAQAGEFSVMLALVAAGVGVALIPSLAALPCPPGVWLTPLARPITRGIYAVTRTSAASKPSIGLMLEELQAASSEWLEEHAVTAVTAVTSTPL
jgi:DNA-binding transcriptional LysR family regulator